MDGISMWIGQATNGTGRRDEVVFGDGSYAALSSDATTRLWLPACPNLVLPRSLSSALMERADFFDGSLDAELLRRFLLGQLDAIAPSRGAPWSLLGEDTNQRELLSEVLAPRWSRSRLIRIGQLGLALPTRAPVQWSLPLASVPTPATLGQAVDHAPEEPALDLSHFLSASEPPSATGSGITPDYSSVVLPALSAALLPREQMAVRPSRISARQARRRGGFTRRVKVLAGAAAAAAIALMLASPAIDHSAPVRVAANEGVSTLPPWTSGGTVASPIQTASPAGASVMRVRPMLARETPANPLVTASVAWPLVTQPAEVAPGSAPVTVARAKPAAIVPVRLDAALVAPSTAAQTTIVPRGIAASSRRHKATKQPFVAALARKRPDVATLVLPDVLKPQ